MSRFAGRGAIVTGAASGLGEAVATGLAAEGAQVLVADVDGAGARRVAQEITAEGGRAESFEVDVTRAGQVKAMVDASLQAIRRLDVLVLSAAVEVRTSIVDLSDEQWQRVIDVNLKGPFLCMRSAIPVMVSAGGGSVVALGSTLGLMAAPGYPAYCASKAALVNLCKQAAIENARSGVRVNVVAPSATTAGLFMKVTAEAGDPDALRAKIARQVPLGRLGAARDVVAAVLFLASDEASYVSGAVLPLDGGMAARRA